MINTPQDLNGNIIQDNTLNGNVSSGQLTGTISSGSGSLSGTLTNKGVISAESSSISSMGGTLNDISAMSGELNNAVIETGDYNKLINKPQINDVELIGNRTLDELGIQPKGTYATVMYVDTEISRVESMIGVATYIYEQTTASNEWIIAHNLNKYPSVTVTDSALSVVYGEIEYTDSNNLIIRFNGAFTGKALLN